MGAIPGTAIRISLRLPGMRAGQPLSPVAVSSCVRTAEES